MLTSVPHCFLVRRAVLVCIAVSSGPAPAGILVPSSGFSCAASGSKATRRMAQQSRGEAASGEPRAQLPCGLPASFVAKNSSLPGAPARRAGPSWMA